MPTIPPASDLFADATSPIDVATKFESYKSSLTKALDNPLPGGLRGEDARVHKAVQRGAAALNKSLSPSAVESVRQSLATTMLNKDLDLAGPGSTGGLHLYDLEAPAKELVPRNTPLRNRLARTQGVGIAHEFKRILGFTGAQTGGLPLIHPGQAETDETTWGSLSLRRGQKISYAGDDIVVPFRKYSISDTVSWDAQYAGTGFQSLQALSATSTLYSAMLLEERMLLAGLGTASGFLGSLATPSAPTVTTPAAGAGQTAVTGVTGSNNVYVVICANTMWGSSALSSVGNSAFTTGDIITATWAQVPGATSYSVFIGQGSSAPATSAMWLAGSTPGNSLTVQGALVTSGTSASAAAAAATPTGYSAGYDGIIPILMDSDQSGSVTYLNGPLTSVDPFQSALSDMFDANQANPETILMNGHDRLTLSNLLTSQSSASYRIMIDNGPDGSNGSVGALATAVQNGVTGALLSLEVHPYMPRGVAPIMSWHLPIPDSNVSNCWEVVNVQDVLGVAWPSIQFSFDYSVYWVGTFVGMAPAWSGIVAGITAD